MSTLSTFEQHWDQSRARLGAKYYYEDEQVLIATDFECGNGEEIGRTGADSFVMRAETEPGYGHMFEGKCTYFCVGLHNKSATARRVHLTITNLTHDLHEVRYVTVRTGRDQWSHVTGNDVVADTERGVLRIGVDLPPWQGNESAVFLSYFHWYAYTDMVQHLRSVAAAHSFADLRAIGATAHGRDILALGIGDPQQAARIVVAQTLQPSESGHWSCRSIIDYLVSDDPVALTIRARNFISIVPHTNPDGTVLGHGMTNALGQASHFLGAHAAAGDAAAAGEEATALWRHLVELRPRLYLEWHSAFQKRRPKHVLYQCDPQMSTDPLVQQRIARCNEVLAALPENTLQAMARTEAVGYNAVAELGTAYVSYKLHDRVKLATNLAHVRTVLAALEPILHD